MAEVGQKFNEFSFIVERGKIKEFVQAIGDGNPLYTDKAAAEAAGYPDVIVPPTFLTIMDNWAGPDFDQRCRLLEIDPLKVLHAEQGYEYLKPIHPGDELTAVIEVTDIYEKQGKSGKMTFIVMKKEYLLNNEIVAVCYGNTGVRE